MKLCNIIFIIVNLILITSALPSKLFYYNGARSAPYKNGMMYVQYTQPRYRNIAAGSVRAYSSGDTLTTGTYVNPVDCDDEKHTETFAARVDLSANEKDTATSVAEAYPPPQFPEVIVQPPEVADKINYNFEESSKPEIEIVQTSLEDQQQPSGEVEEDIEIELAQPVDEQPQEEPQPEVITNRKDRTGGFNHNRHQVDVEQVQEVEQQHYLPPTTTVSYAENEVTIRNEATTSLPPTVLAPIAPIVPVIPVVPLKPVKPNRPKVFSIAPKKKIQVRLDYPTDEEDDDVQQQQEEEIYTHYNRVVPKPVYLPNRGPPAPAVTATHEISGTNYAASQSATKKKSEQSPNPGQSFFPVYFGGDNGGSAIAIANSYSTGEGGAATSHAIAYGNPNSSQLRHKKIQRGVPVKH